MKRAIPVLVVWIFGAAAFAQSAPTTPAGGTRGGTLVTGQLPFDNANGGGLADRSPGNMVGAGVAAQQTAAEFGRSRREITETEEPVDAIEVFLVDAIDIVFDQLNLAMLLFENALRARAGLPPRVPGLDDVSSGTDLSSGFDATATDPDSLGD